MVTTHCGDHFVMYKNIESLGCTPETNGIVYVNYTSMTKKYWYMQQSGGITRELC